ncbi:hypothetical protein BpHYR1_040443 [Brachionus plicatilis]|uniref:Uncharacterized protein n=1 Tax=Brachionus plicatilis TaxID=10195 RepID=A0A3M7QYD7_BRAPC|nr:hypothetical protein BpHYR1_040443 [Brachionus plicatilis]
MIGFCDNQILPPIYHYMKKNFKTHSENRILQCEILVQKLQYKKIPSPAKTLQFIAYFNQGFSDGVHFTENCRVFAELGILFKFNLKNIIDLNEKTFSKIEYKAEIV